MEEVWTNIATLIKYLWVNENTQSDKKAKRKQERYQILLAPYIIKNEILIHVRLGIILTLRMFLLWLCHLSFTLYLLSVIWNAGFSHNLNFWTLRSKEVKNHIRVLITSIELFRNLLKDARSPITSLKNEVIFRR